MTKELVMHVNPDYVPQTIEAMRKAGYKLHNTTIIDTGFIHLEFRPRKK